MSSLPSLSTEPPSELPFTIDQAMLDQLRIGISLASKLQEADSVYQQAVKQGASVWEQLEQEREAWLNEKAKYLLDIAEYQHQLADVELRQRTRPTSPKSPTRTQVSIKSELEEVFAEEVAEMHAKVANMEEREARVRSSYRTKREKDKARISELAQAEEARKSELKVARQTCAQLRSEVARLTSQLTTTTAALTSTTSSDLQQLIGVVNELQGTNFNLKADVAQLRELLAEAREEITRLQQNANVGLAPLLSQDEDAATDRCTLYGELGDSMRDSDKSPPSALLSSSYRTLDAELMGLWPSNTEPATAQQHLPGTSPTLPDTAPDPLNAHHPGNGDAVRLARNNKSRGQLSGLFSNPSPTQSSLSAASSPADTPPQAVHSLHLPPTSQQQWQALNKRLLAVLEQLHAQSASALQRLCAADTVALNRKLRRAFDMDKLTELSGEMIDGIKEDLGKLEERSGLRQFMDEPPLNTLGDMMLRQLYGDSRKIVEVLVPHHLQLLEKIADQQTSLNHYARAYVDRMQEKSQTEEAQALERSRTLSLTTLSPTGAPRTASSAMSTVASIATLGHTFMHRAMGSLSALSRPASTSNLSDPVARHKPRVRPKLSEATASSTQNESSSSSS
ncbi:hypothetical protein RI367_000115 [Sorochytrium milnesiophthora]